MPAHRLAAGAQGVVLEAAATDAIQGDGRRPVRRLPILSEFHGCNGSLAFACMSRLGALALDADSTDKTLRGIIDWPGGVAAIVKAMRCYEGHRELILPGYMLVCALCQHAKDGAIAVVQAEGIEPLIDLLKVSVHEPHLLHEGLAAMKMMATTGPTAKQQLIDKQGVYGIVWAMREHQEDVLLLVRRAPRSATSPTEAASRSASTSSSTPAWRGVPVMRKHIDAIDKNREPARRRHRLPHDGRGRRERRHLRLRGRPRPHDDDGDD